MILMLMWPWSTGRDELMYTVREYFRAMGIIQARLSYRKGRVEDEGAMDEEEANTVKQNNASDKQCY